MTNIKENTNQSASLIPKLRFKEFKEKWEQKKLGNISTFSKGKSISKSDIVEDGNLECIRYGELYTVYSEIIEDIKSKTNLKEDNLVLSEINDVIIPASGETQIDIATASCVLKNGVALGGDLNIIKSKANGVFLSYYLNSKRKIDIARLSQGTSVVHLYSSQLKTLSLNLPQNEEQQKIANFLTAFDTKIQQLNTKKEKLVQYKKGNMQQLFSQQLRFNDDVNDFEDWEEKRLGEVCKSIKSGKSKSSEKGTFPLYGSTGIIGKCEYFSHYGFYILIARVGANAGTINVIDDKFGVSDNTLVLVCNEDTDIKFIYYFLDFYNLNRLIFGSGQPLITGGQLRSLKLKIPHQKEQQKIATFLSAIDKKIEAIAKQIHNTQQFKKGLLQQLFV